MAKEDNLGHDGLVLAALARAYAACGQVCWRSCRT